MQKSIKINLAAAGLIIKIDTEDIYKKENIRKKPTTAFIKPKLEKY